jgi:membrane-associated phospholipid phosphatase
MTDWKLKKLLLWHLVLVFLVSSFLWAPTAYLWKKLDVGFFSWINSSLRGPFWWQNFWALANHKMADWVEDVFILGFFIAYVRQAQKGLRLKRVSLLVFIVLYIAAILYFVNRMFFRKTCQIPRESPTLVVDGSVRLSEHISWLHIKDDSTKSFPGDHGTTALLFSFSYFILAGWRLGLVALAYGVFLCLPRLITGAHWLSDVILGSGCITILFLSWAFCTPLASFCSKKIETFLRFLGSLFSREKKKRTDQQECEKA